MSTATPIRGEPDEVTSRPITIAREEAPTREKGTETEPARSTVTAVLAALRLATGFIFLWAFLDKTFGFGYATQSENSWLNGGSPTEGFLSHVSVGPFQDVFNDMAGLAWVDWLFMLGLAGIGIAVMTGVGLRIAAVSGTLLMAFMWAAEWPLARHTSTGELSMSNNPLIDYHVIYALALILVAVTHAGDRFGFGRLWARLPIVQRHSTVLR